MEVILNNDDIQSKNHHIKRVVYSTDGDFIDYDFNSYEQYSGLSGDEFEEMLEDVYDSADGKKKGKFLSKLKGFGQKVGGGLKKAGAKLKNFIGKLKPKKGARKLKKVKTPMGMKHVDVIPPVVPSKNSRGEEVMVRPNPDGSRTEFPKSDTTVAPNGKAYANEDLKRSGNVTTSTNPATGVKELLKEVPASDVKTLKTEDGEEISFRAEDLVDKETGESVGMNPKLKNGLIIGGVILGVFVLGFVIYKVANRKGK